MPAEVAHRTKYASGQMAAEALLDCFNNQATAQALQSGNERSSKFTRLDAAQSAGASAWKVEAHSPSSGTGFSATLFRYMGETDENRGFIANELVMSFRSTEFVDDSARDSE